MTELGRSVSRFSFSKLSSANQPDGPRAEHRHQPPHPARRAGHRLRQRRDDCVKTCAAARANLLRMQTTKPQHPTVAPADLAGQREYLLRFARRRLRDAALAEDVVHDVFAAVIAGQARFEQRSSLRTWLTAILKHKIVDAVRKRGGECSLDALTESDAAPMPVALAAMATMADHADPCLLAEQRQTLRRTLSRLEALPASLRRVFEMHVVLGHSTAEVCGALNLTPGNLWVRVHRARKQLLAA